MKKVFIGALAITLATATVQAQRDTTKNFRREQHNRPKEGPYAQLNLTTEQQAKIKSLREELKQKHEALKTEKLTEAERRSQSQALREQHKAAMEAILTPEQKQQLEKVKSERKKDMRGGKRSLNRDSSITRNGTDRRSRADLEKELALTTEQQAKMSEIRTAFKKQAETVRNDAALTSEQKREKLRELMKKQQAEFKTMLTKEQQEKLESLRKERAPRDTK